MSWKDLFTFSRSERNGIIVFIILLTIIILTPQIHKEFFLKETRVDPENFKKQILAFEEQLSKLKKESKFSGKSSRTYKIDEVSEIRRAIILKPFGFNPNNLPEESWLKMGMPERIVRNIKNFEAAGGSFLFKEDLKRLYLITDEIYYQLEPYIELPPKDIHEKETESISIISKHETKETKKPLIVDINTADSLELLEIRGIGPVFSSRILSYRELLGGYASIEQLLDVYGMDEERFETIKKYVTIKDTIINKININEAGFSDILRHPYFDRNIANNIIQMRRHHGKFQKIEDIKKSHLIDDDLFTLITPYIKVE